MPTTPTQADSLPLLATKVAQASSQGNGLFGLPDATAHRRAAHFSRDFGICDLFAASHPGKPGSVASLRTAASIIFIAIRHL
jgi:hypothetical protein